MAVLAVTRSGEVAGLRHQDIGALLGRLARHSRRLSVLTARSPSPRVTLSTKLSRPRCTTACRGRAKMAIMGRRSTARLHLGSPGGPPDFSIVNYG
jgi:hypothetical protein